MENISARTDYTFISENADINKLIQNVIKTSIGFKQKNMLK